MHFIRIKSFLTFFFLFFFKELSNIPKKFDLNVETPATDSGALNLAALVWHQEFSELESFTTSWLAAAFHPQCYSSLSFQNTAKPKSSSVCLWMWQILWDALERPWKNPNIITDQSDTAESCFHYFLPRHKVKDLLCISYSLFMWGSHPADLLYSAIGASMPPHCCLSLSPSCLVDCIFSL